MFRRLYRSAGNPLASRSASSDAQQAVLHQHFGPQAQLLAKPFKTPAGTQFRAAVQFRLLGFPVELLGSPQPSDTTAEAWTVNHFVHVSGTPFFHPTDRSHDTGDDRRQREKINKLREVCQALGRNLKFSVSVEEQKGDASSGSEQSKPKYTCRASCRDEWDMTPRLNAVHQTPPSSSAHAALIAAFEHMLLAYRAEGENETSGMADFAELQAFLSDSGRKANLKQSGAPTTQQGSRFQRRGNQQQEAQPTATIEVVDQNGNTQLFTATRPSSAAALRDAVEIVYVETQGFERPGKLTRGRLSILGKLHWQLSNTLVQEAIENEDTDESSCSDPLFVEQVQPTFSLRVLDEGKSFVKSFEGTLSANGQVLATATGPGMLKLELECFAKALGDRIAANPDLARTFAARYFPTSTRLERTMENINGRGCNVAQRTNDKPTPYAALGVTVQHHLGGPYTVEYEEVDGGAAVVATVVVNDGFSDPRRILGYAYNLNNRNGVKVDKYMRERRGEAWKTACISILAGNFLPEYASVRYHPAFTSSTKGNAPSAGGEKNANSATTKATSTKVSATASNKKIVAGSSSLAEVVEALGFRQLKWTCMQYTDTEIDGQFFGKIHVSTKPGATDPDTELFVSPVLARQKKQAKKIAFRLAAQRFFPEELEQYLALGRSDHFAGDALKDLRLPSAYDPTRPLVRQVLDQLGKSMPSAAPLNFTLERHYASSELESDNDGSDEELHRPFKPRFKATILGANSKTVAEQLGDEHVGPLQVLRSALQSTAGHSDDEQLVEIWREYEQTVDHTPAPPPWRYSKFLFEQFFGRELEMDVTMTYGPDGINVYVATAMLRCGDETLSVARAWDTRKVDAVRLAHISAIRSNFMQKVKHEFEHRDNNTWEVAREVIAERISHDPPPMPEVPEPAEARAPPPPTPHNLLRTLVQEDDPEYTTRHEQTPLPNNGGYVCRVYRQKVTAARQNRRGPGLQELGVGHAPTKPQALHVAAIEGLRNMFESELNEIVSKHASYAQMPPAHH